MTVTETPVPNRFAVVPLSLHELIEDVLANHGNYNQAVQVKRLKKVEGGCMRELTATERLRALLDERGEYYQTSGNRTWWGRPIDARTGEPINVFHNQAQPMGEDRLLVELQLATPEQAVVATLGPGTCRYEWSLADNGWADHTCSACGFCENTDIHVSLGWNYCPNCGARVIGA